MDQIVTPSHPQIHVHPEPVTMTLFGNEVFAVVTKFEMRPKRIRAGLKPRMARSSKRRDRVNTETRTHGGEGQAEVEAEMGGRSYMPSAARHPRGWGRREGGVAPPTRRFWTFGLQNRERIHFSCCKPPVCGPLFPPPREAPFFLHVALRGTRPSHGLAGRRAVGPRGWDGASDFVG